MPGIDVIIPSYRANVEHILPILNLARPEGVIVNFYLIIDNPAVLLDEEIKKKSIDDNAIHIIINEHNISAALARNRGIDSSTGNWILFLDDDIAVKPDLLNIYSGAIIDYKDEIGFIGLVTLPSATTAFTKATIANGSAGIFEVANKKDYFAWGATANVMVKRAALGSIRFWKVYPKAGGGEDVDFFLRIRQANNYQDFKTLKAAEVWHPWWNKGEVNLVRAFRYGKGTAWLINKNPQYAYYDFFSTPETLILSILALLICFLLKPVWTIPLTLFITGVIVIEVIANLVNCVRRGKRLSPVVLLYVILLKLYYDFGVVSENLSKGLFTGFCKRFNDNGSLKKNHFIRFNRYKITKVVLYTLLIIWLIAKCN